MAFIANGLLSVLPSSSFSILARHTNVSLSTAGMIFTVASLGTIAAIMVSNPFVQRIGAKYVLMAGLAGLITASLVIPTTPVFNLWLVAQFLQGSSSSLINVGLTMILTLNFHEELGEKLNTLYGTYGIGALLAPILLSFSLSSTGNALSAFLPIPLLSGICLLLLYIIEFRSKPDQQESAAQDNPAEASVSLGKILHQSLLWLVVLQVCLYTGTESGFSNWLVTSLSQSAAIALQKATPAASFFWLGLTSGRLLLAQFMKRGMLQDKRLLYISFIGGGIFGMLVTT
ncbi:MAG: MFS transporter, partial [Ktedonobacteraceae bacterium]